MISSAEEGAQATHLGAEFQVAEGGATYLRTADGGQVPVPPDFPQRAARHGGAVQTAHQVARVLAGWYVPELREFQEFIAPAFAGDPFEPGGPLHEQVTAVNAIEAFMGVYARAEADLAAVTAQRSAAAEQQPVDEQQRVDEQPQTGVGE